MSRIISAPRAYLTAATVEEIVTRSLAGEHAFDIDRVGTIYPAVYADRIDAHVSGVRQPITISIDR